MVTCSDSKAVRSNRVPMGIAPYPYLFSGDGILGSSEPRGENPGVVAATFLAPGPYPQGMQPLLVWTQVEVRCRSAGRFLHSGC